MSGPLVMIPGSLTLAKLRRIARGGAPVTLADGWRGPVEASARTVARAAAGDAAVYGVNTGFGLLARKRIPPDRVRELQRRLVLSHCAGTGPALDAAAVRLILALKAAALARGYSGVRPVVIEALLALHDRGVLPVIPAKGSVGASGDLAPLAHLTAVLIGEGEAMVEGERMPGAAALARAGLAPVELEAKEGLALLNGTQVSTALALIGLFAAEETVAAALVAGAMSVDAAMGSDGPFDDRIHAARGQPGQRDVAAVYRRLLAGSGIRDSHRGDHGTVQDPYSLRCQPQVMGAVLDHLRFAAGVLEREANAISDNPLVFADDGAILSGGNFHAEPVAMAADVIAIALAETGSLSERRTALLMDTNLSGLPPFLVRDGGLNSGFMIAQVTAAALTAENKQMAHPASVDSLPTSANQEDHVSMATHAARRLGEMADNLAGILAVELLAAAQGIDLRAPLVTAPELGRAHALLRGVAAAWVDDRAMAPDIAAAKALVTGGRFLDFAAELLPSGG
ncbi:histidine ammonia-lyase [Azospirillum sp. RWY-5-1]|uniref:Histidine ammonia-lyase n=1 Tax=Azospirillum oleiclasticum TaxID=2735135 RepID=A0ABX2T997_9PROT|nr:histidine ammonia-lyase [Azospirillum oleiclasticum]NYZ12105.1 histidine ammonia-lyase [Azospirillum oleiclasticum]NYZ19265.1 histidine ammonia-lyase [Azospirillum oleiclasticum]